MPHFAKCVCHFRCDALPSANCARSASGWTVITSSWGIAFIVEALVDDPLFIMVALVVRRYFPVLLAHELCFKNSRVFCAPIFQCYNAVLRAFARCFCMP